MGGNHTIEAITIGASAGAIEALSSILPRLPRGFPIPIIVVVHIPPDRKSAIAELFQAKCKVRVKEAEDTEPIEPSTVYMAPPDYHLLVESNRTLSLSQDEPVMYSRPSIDVLFESAADALGEKVMGIILTGANSDGARGLRAVCKAGGAAIVQRSETAYASAMPQAALAACPDAMVLDLDDIATYLHNVGQVREK